MKTKAPTLISHDHLIRPVLKGHLRAIHPGARMADELNVNEARIDLAFVSNALHGYEIKAENDTFSRFLIQSMCYGIAFDYLTLVTTLKKGEKMREELPPHWGLLIACEKEGAVDFWHFREPKPNPDKHAMGVLKLLWRQETLGFPGEPGWYKGAKNDIMKLRQRIQGFADLPTITAYVCQCLKAREGWRDENGLSLGGFA